MSGCKPIEKILEQLHTSNKEQLDIIYQELEAFFTNIIKTDDDYENFVICINNINKQNINKFNFLSNSLYVLSKIIHSIDTILDMINSGEIKTNSNRLTAVELSRESLYIIYDKWDKILKVNIILSSYKRVAIHANYFGPEPVISMLDNIDTILADFNVSDRDNYNFVKKMIDTLYFKLEIGEPRQTSTRPGKSGTYRLNKMDERISIFIEKWKTELDKAGPPLKRY
jgi:hypothetical protein